MQSLHLLLAFLLFGLAAAGHRSKTHRHDWTITWTNSNPDGLHPRRVMGVNNIWPPPQLSVTVGDRLIITVTNGLGDQDTSLHFHGLFQNGTNHMDGPVQVTQCPIPPGKSFVYDFTVDQPGTYWYHSHAGPQYPDGFRAALIVNDPDSPFRGMYTREKVLTLSDWYWDEMVPLAHYFMTPANAGGQEPVPNSTLINNSRDVRIGVESATTYLLRIINVGAFASQYLWFQDHTMQVVEVDGVYTEPKETGMVYLAAAQRVSVLLTTKKGKSCNFPFVASMDRDMFDGSVDSDRVVQNATGWLVYDRRRPLPEPELISEYNPLPDEALTPYDHHPLLPEPDHTVELDITMDQLSDGVTHAFFSGITWVPQLVPSLYTALTTRNYSTDPVVYGVNSGVHILPHLSVIEIVLTNQDDGKHPFHLHGHNFQVLPLDGPYPAFPVRRDTVTVPALGGLRLRFRADNPGVWLFHCHIEWHVVSGLVATFVVAPDVLQRKLHVPKEQLRICRGPAAGNAAGNTKDFLDLTGANVSPPPLPPVAGGGAVRL